MPHSFLYSAFMVPKLSVSYYSCKLWCHRRFISKRAGRLIHGLSIFSKIFLLGPSYNLFMILPLCIRTPILKTRIVDAMDLFEELENMALNSLEPKDEDRNEPSDEDIARW